MSLQQRCIFVTGLLPDVKSEDLGRLFKDVGVVEKSVFLPSDRESTAGRSAFICFASKDTVKAALRWSKDGIRTQALTEGQEREVEELLGDTTGDILSLYKALSSEEKRQFLMQATLCTNTGEASAAPNEASAAPNEASAAPNEASAAPNKATTAPTEARTDERTRLVTSDLGNHVIIHEPPKLPVFSGLQGRDTNFGRWKSEVGFLEREQPSQVVINVIRRSLRSPAADLVTYLDHRATVATFLQKLESVYGTVGTGRATLQKLYSERQATNERVADWACRLENLAFQAVDKGMMSREAVEDVVSGQLWSGLRDARLKDALRHRRHGLKFEQLVIEARELEEEYSGDGKKPTTQQQQKQPTETELLMELIKKLDARMEKMEKRMTPTVNSKTQEKSPEKKSTKCTKCKEEGHLYFACRKDAQPEVTCHKCRRVGHIARGCRAEPLPGNDN